MPTTYGVNHPNKKLMFHCYLISIPFLGEVVKQLVLEILPYVFLLENEAKHAQNTKHINNRIQRTKTLT